MDVNDYEFETRLQKKDFINEESFFDSEEYIDLYVCPVCKKLYDDIDNATDCCHTDCYEQDKEFEIELRADAQNQEEKDGRLD